MTEEFFSRGIEEIIEEKSFFSKLKSGKPLRIKLGMDPTRPDVHLGHSVSLLRLKYLQELGHKIIIIIGDYTTKIGDPSGRNSARPMMSDSEIKKNAATYFKQVTKILNKRRTEIRFNSEWFRKMNFNDVLQTAGKFTVSNLLERDDFSKRLKDNAAVGLHELLYPLMQAYDSVVLEADIAFCGSDQKFNELAGRELQKKMGQTPQDIVMTKLLVGLDGHIKMSKSADNYIGITEKPESQFGKVMSIPDNLIIDYYELCTDLPSEEINNIKKKLKQGENPRDIKLNLAKEIVGLYHGAEAAEKAQGEFVSVFSKKELPSDMPEVKISGDYKLFNLLTAISGAKTNSEARRLILQGGVKIDGAKANNPDLNITVRSGMVIQVGKKKFFKVR